MIVQNVVSSLRGKRIYIKQIDHWIFSELRPVIVEPWDIRDEEDGLPEKSLTRTPVYNKSVEIFNRMKGKKSLLI